MGDTIGDQYLGRKYTSTGHGSNSLSHNGKPLAR